MRKAKKVVGILITLIVLSISTTVFASTEPIPFETNDKLGFVYAHLISAIDGSPFISYFNEITGRVSHFDMQGESMGFRYVDSIDDFWTMVNTNAEVTRRSQSRGGIPQDTFFVGYNTMEVIHINEYGDAIEIYFDTVENFEEFLTAHGLQSLSDWQREQERIEYLREIRMRELGFQSFEEMYAAFDEMYATSEDMHSALEYATVQPSSNPHFDFTNWYVLRHAGAADPAAGGGHVSLGGARTTVRTWTGFFEVVHMNWCPDAIPLSRWSVFISNAHGDDTFGTIHAPVGPGPGPAIGARTTMSLRFPGEVYEAWGSVFRTTNLTISHRARIRVLNW